MNRVAQHPVRAFLAALAAVALLSVMDAVMKHLVLAMGLFSISVWRSIVGFGIVSALYLPQRPVIPAAPVLRLHVSRGTIVTVMAGLFFWGIARVPLAQALALTFIAPLIALLLAGVFLHEHIGRRSIVGSVLAFAGVIVIVVGQARGAFGDEVLFGSAAIIASALCYAVNIVLMRHQALAAKPLEITFYQSLTIAVLWAALIPFMGVPRWPEAQWVWVIVVALLSTGGGMLFAWAYARAEASYLAVTEYSGFLWAAALGRFFFHERVSFYTIAGAALIVGGCLVAAKRKPAVPPEIDALA